MIHKLGKYRIIAKLGEGAMGTVYAAHDDILDRRVAIKTMAEDLNWDPELKLRFYREARSVASLHHPNIVTIYDLGEEGRLTYIVMEYLEGSDLKSLIAEMAPIPLERKLSIMAQVADGLSHAHSRGIVHRDVKPGNIHLTQDGTAKVLDFGIARLPASDLTRSGDRLGTPVYMSPEQIRDMKYDARSDIFSCGIVLYEFLTYVHPFRDRTLEKTLDNILNRTDLFFEQRFPDAPPELSAILNRCLAKDPRGRYQSVAELGQACRDLIRKLDQAKLQMTAELQRVMHRLGEIGGHPDASSTMGDLVYQAGDLLGHEERQDYVSVKRVLEPLRNSVMRWQGPSVPSPPGILESQTADLGIGPSAGTPSRPSDRVDGANILEDGRGDRSPLPSRATSQKPQGAPPSPTAPPESFLSLQEIRGNELLVSGRRLLAEGALDEALEELRRAMNLLGPKEEVINAIAETRQRIQELNHARAMQLQDSARESMSAARYADALRDLDGILELEPGRDDIIELRRQALAGLETERALQARKELGEREKVSGFALLAEKKYVESLAALRRAGELLGEDTAIRLGVQEAQAGIRAEKMEAEIQEEITNARQHLRAEAFDKARACVLHVLELSPANSEARDLLDRLEKVRQEMQIRDEISSRLAKGKDALGRQDFIEAAVCAQEVLRIDPQNAGARDLLDQIDAAKERKRREIEIIALLDHCHEAHGAGALEEALHFAQEILRIYPSQREAKSLVKQIQKDIRQASRTREREHKERERGEEEERKTQEDIDSAGGAEGKTVVLQPSISRTGNRKILLWSSIVICTFLIAFAATLLVGKRYFFPGDFRVQVEQTRSLLAQLQFDEAIEGALRILSASPQNAEAWILLDAARNEQRRRAFNSLFLRATLSLQQAVQLKDAQASPPAEPQLVQAELTEQVRAAQAAIQAALQIDPSYAPAAQLRDAIAQQMDEAQKATEKQQQVADWVSKIVALINAGNAREAKAELSAMGRLYPEHPEIRRLQQLLRESRTSAEEMPKRVVPEPELDRKRRRVDEWRARAERLFKQGSYDELQGIAGEWTSEDRENPEAEFWRSRAEEAQRLLRTYEATFKDRRYADAEDSLERLRQTNPDDPRLAQLTAQLSKVIKEAKAFLSVNRLRQSATLLLDNESLGAEGEVEDKIVAVGKHKILVRFGNDYQSSEELEFRDGDHHKYVYDTSTRVLRKWTPADEILIAKRRRLEELHRFPVHHSHFVGRCEGYLLFSGSFVEYRSDNKNHAFRRPFERVDLQIEDGKLVFTDLAEKKELRKLTLKDANRLQDVRVAWDTLKLLLK